MHTKSYIDVYEVIEYRREALYRADNDLERGICERLLAEAIAEWRANPDWDELPF